MVERHLGRVLGILSYEVDLKTDSATVIYDAKVVTTDQIVQAVADAGYRASQVKEIR